MSKREVLVTGDVLVDWFELTEKPDASVTDRESENWKHYPRFARLPSLGGAILTAGLLSMNSELIVNCPQFQKDINSLNSEDVVGAEAKVKRKNPVQGDVFVRYNIDVLCGYNGPLSGAYPRSLDPSYGVVNYPMDAKGAEYVIIDDHGNGFRNKPELFPHNINENAKVIYRMDAPLLRGELWDNLRSKISLENLIVIINADYIRKTSEASISSGISWEKTAMDFIYQIHLNPHLKGLRDCANLIVLFKSEGAILYNGGANSRSRLIFDPNCLEGFFAYENKCTIKDSDVVFSAVFASAIIKNGIGELEQSVKTGLKAVRNHALAGYRINQSRHFEPCFDEITSSDDKIQRSVLRKSFYFSTVTIPKTHDLINPDPCYWRIMDQKISKTKTQVSRNILVKGYDKSLEDVPEIGFDKILKSMDRREIEAYGSIKKTLREYIDLKSPENPLCIAVFGSPGSGKSFAVKHIAKGLGVDNISDKTFNLSQMKSPDVSRDLCEALHEVRDIVLSGNMPLVFFDEFDSDGLKWLKYFLTPMQDGTFLDNGREYHIGKAIFVFAGGVYESFASFAASTDNPANDKLLKKPDFLSRLKGFVDIMGPNPEKADKDDSSSLQDEAYILRRAKVLRSMFERSKSAESLLSPDGKTLNIDSAIIRAMLRVPNYKHGNRSLQSIIQMSRLNGNSFFDCSMLPSLEQLALHVDEKDFHFLLEKERFFNYRIKEEAFVGSMARTLHDYYISERKRKNQSIKVSENFDELSDDKKRSNLNAAEDIPRKLKAIGFWIQPVGSHGFAHSPLITDEELEKMAAMEHDRWVNEQEQQGWRYGDRDDVRKVHPNLVPYDKLPYDIKLYDLESVSQIPVILGVLGYEVIRAVESEHTVDQGFELELAMEIHKNYICNRRQEGQNESEYLVPFEKLPEEIKYSNMDNAYHIPNKLYEAGYYIRPLENGEDFEFEGFSTEGIEIMAKFEHLRWVWERRIQGWLFDPLLNIQDRANKLTPYFVKYDELPEELKEYDRQMVRIIPKLMKQIGYGIFKISQRIS